MASTDQLQRFIFDHTDVRGEIITLGDSYQRVLHNGLYPVAVEALLGEFLAAAGLLSATMKFDGTITLQARGSGDLPLIMADCTRQHQLRAIAQLNDDGDFSPRPLTDLLGNGHLAITIDPAQGERYQGIVPLESGNLSGCLEDYFDLSEQLPTRLWLFADGQRAGGLLLQALPAKAQKLEERDHYWEHLSALANTLSADELLQLDHSTVLHRLFHEEQIRLFESRPMHFGCTCSQSRTADMIVSLGRQEAFAILDDMGSIDVDCQFCHQQYHFDRSAVEALFAGEPPTLH